MCRMTQSLPSAVMERGGFVVSVAVPRPQDFTPGGKGRVFALNRDHVGIETLDDPVGQVA